MHIIRIFKIVFALGIFLFWKIGEAQDEKRLYIEKYKKIAISEMDRTGIPASIKLAQALVESNAGRSTLARKANNHFGIKCGSDWAGGTYNQMDDEFDQNGNPKSSCFRSYSGDEESFIAHSEFLRDPKKINRYGFLFRLDSRDYISWAFGLKRSGYATHPQYAEMLIKTIEDNKLHDFDLDHSLASPIVGDFKDGFLFVNGVKTVYARTGDTPGSIADNYNVSLKKLLANNEELTSAGQPLPVGYVVFLQKKRGNFRGKQKFYYVKAGDKMTDISRMFGLQLSKLYRKNRMPEGSQPQEGEGILLRGTVKKNQGPKLKTQGGPSRPELPSAPPIRKDEDMFDWEITPQEQDIDIAGSKKEIDKILSDTIKSDLKDLPRTDSIRVDSFKTGGIKPERIDTIPTEAKVDTIRTTGIPTKVITPSFPIPKSEKQNPSVPQNNDLPLSDNPNVVKEEPASIESTQVISVKENGNIPPVKNNPEPDKKGPIFHLIEKGDTLYNISKRYGTTVEALRLLNGMKPSDSIKLGTKIRVL
jgi:LysM repeat protein